MTQPSHTRLRRPLYYNNMSTDVIRLSDAKLNALYQAAQIEVRRRTAKTCNKLDDATIIKGNEMGKRALTVAAAGS